MGLHAAPNDAAAEVSALVSVYNDVEARFGSLPVVLLGDLNADWSGCCVLFSFLLSLLILCSPVPTFPTGPWRASSCIVIAVFLGSCAGPRLPQARVAWWPPPRRARSACTTASSRLASRLALLTAPLCFSLTKCIAWTLPRLPRCRTTIRWRLPSLNEAAELCQSLAEDARLDLSKKRLLSWLAGEAAQPPPPPSFAQSDRAPHDSDSSMKQPQFAKGAWRAFFFDFLQFFLIEEGLSQQWRLSPTLLSPKRTSLSSRTLQFFFEKALTPSFSASTSGTRAAPR